MFTRETMEEVIGECFLKMEEFEKEFDGIYGTKSVRLNLCGVDGGGFSTYGQSVRIAEDDEYECRDGYLLVHSRKKDYNVDHKRRELRQKVSFVPYGSIVSVECGRVVGVE